MWAATTCQHRMGASVAVFLDRFHGRRASRGCPYDDSRIMEKWRSTMPVNSITPMATIHTTKATPVIRCMIVAASTHISCIPIPISADAGAMRLMRPPAFHCRCAAASSDSSPAQPVYFVGRVVAGSTRINEDPRSASGWSIGNTYYRKIGTDSWETITATTPPLAIGVYGTPK